MKEKKFLTPNLEKKLVAGSPQQIQSPECLVKEKILKIFKPQIWSDQKKLVNRPLSQEFRVQSAL